MGKDSTPIVGKRTQAMKERVKDWNRNVSELYSFGEDLVACVASRFASLGCLVDAPIFWKV